MTSEGRRKPSPLRWELEKLLRELRVSSRFARYGFGRGTWYIHARTHTHVNDTYEQKGRLVHNVEQSVGRSHCEINEFFTIGTLTATRLGQQKRRTVYDNDATDPAE